MDLVGIAIDLLRTVVLLPITRSVKDEAGALPPSSLRSLDAIHLATALEIRSDLTGLLTYDNRLGEAAVNAGLTLTTP